MRNVCNQLVVYCKVVALRIDEIIHLHIYVEQ